MRKAPSSAKPRRSLTAIEQLASAGKGIGDFVADPNDAGFDYEHHYHPDQALARSHADFRRLIVSSLDTVHGDAADVDAISEALGLSKGTRLPFRMLAGKDFSRSHQGRLEAG